MSVLVFLHKSECFEWYSVAIYSLEVERDLIETFKILKQHLLIDSTKLFTLSPINFTRGHNFKLSKPKSRLLVRSKYFTDRIIN